MKQLALKHDLVDKPNGKKEAFSTYSTFRWSRIIYNNDSVTIVTILTSDILTRGKKQIPIYSF